MLNNVYATQYYRVIAVVIIVLNCNKEVKLKIASRIMWRFDRIFGDSRKVGAQVVVIVVFLAILIAIATLVGLLLNANSPDDGERDVLTQTIGLILNIHSLTPSISTLPLWWRAVLSMLSVIVFTAFAVTFIATYVRNRVYAYRNGTVRYYFQGHLLFLGGGAMLPTMLKKVGEDRKLRRRHIVVLTSSEVKDVRRAISNGLTPAERQLKITVLRGNLDDGKALESVYVRTAHRLYIVGDRPDLSDYDSVNIACWNEVRRQCAGRVNVPCFLLLEHASSTRILLRREKESLEVLDTTFVWRPEAIAQRVLVHQGEDTHYPPLDRHGIGYNDRRTVHLVLYGITSFAQAMAVTAAQLCHFPNYLRDKSLRSKITFIAPDIEVQSAQFRASLHRLFAMSHVTSPWTSSEAPFQEDFLDIEWEFVDGILTTEPIRAKLQEYYREALSDNTHLTVAICQNDARDNIADALSLPEEYHQIALKDGQVDYNTTIPIFVYQPDSEELLRVASEEVSIYANLIPVGSVRESYDPSIRRRIEEAKRINYIYSCGLSYSGMTNDNALLDKLWQTSYSNRMSSIYSAMHVGVKQRSVGTESIPEEQLETMARVEHNRWNIEKLLAGYSPVGAVERQQLKQCEATGDTVQLQAIEQELKQRKAKYEHYCIAPYDELPADVQEYDRLIVNNIKDILL